jgi:small subunit ribosomal protein S15
VTKFMLTPQEKAKVLAKTRIHDKDTGSPESQIALFTEEIERLVKHLKKHAKDNSSRTGLLKMVAKRKRLLDYLKRQDVKRYESTIKKLDLKK